MHRFNIKPSKKDPKLVVGIERENMRDVLVYIRRLCETPKIGEMD